jgi:acyl dehydratase
VRRLTKADAVVGEEFSAPVIEDLPRTLMVQYAGASGDYNPLHTDEIYATQVAGYQSVFAHGMLTMGLTGRMVTDLVGDGRLLDFGGRFKGQVWPGDSLTVTARVASVTDAGIVDIALTTVNQRGVVVFAGSASARLDIGQTSAKDSEWTSVTSA